MLLRSFTGEGVTMLSQREREKAKIKKEKESPHLPMSTLSDSRIASLYISAHACLLSVSSNQTLFITDEQVLITRFLQSAHVQNLLHSPV